MNATWHDPGNSSLERYHDYDRSWPAMKLLVAFLIFLALVFCFTALIPILTLGLALAVVLGAVFVWLLPILIIASSDKTTGAEKAAWILAIVFLSWFAWIFYFLLAPLKEKPHYGECRYY